MAINTDNIAQGTCPLTPELFFGLFRVRVRVKVRVRIRVRVRVGFRVRVNSVNSPLSGRGLRGVHTAIPTPVIPTPA